MPQTTHPRKAIPPACRRRITWGEYLRLEVGHRLNPAVDAIREITGHGLGVRNSFTPLLKMPTPPSPNTKEYERAYALLLVLGQSPSDWGIDEDRVPPTLVMCRDLLFNASGWLGDLAAHAA